MVTIDFYTREGCHLCEKALLELEALRLEKAFALRVHDIDGDAELRELYDVLVPVTVLPDGTEMHYRIDAARVRGAI